MRRLLETDLISLKVKLAAIEKKIRKQPGSVHLKSTRNSYQRAINSAETTLSIVNNLDPTILNNVAGFKRKV